MTTADTNRNRLRRIITLVLFIVAFFGAVWVAEIGLQRFTIGALPAAAVSSFAMFLVGLLFTLLDGDGFRGMGLGSRWELKDVLLAMGLMGIHIGGSIVVAIAMMIANGGQPDDSAAIQLFTQFGDLEPLHFLGFGFLLAALAGIGEELIFRGYLITRLERMGLPVWLAVLLPGLAFGLLHSPGYGLISALSKALFFGIPTGIYFIYRRRLAPLMLMHFMVDFGGFIIIYLALRFAPNAL